MALTDVKEALVRIAGPAENEVSLHGQSQQDKSPRQYFCIEDTLLSRDVDVSVEGIGKLSFPLSEDIIKNMITFSSKAKFGRGEDTVLDTSVRDTQVITAKHLKVKIKEDSLSEILEKMCFGLNLGRNASLIPHLYNLLIYGPGQFFEMHRDTEKMKNMVATLVILLPSTHTGGELIIKHDNQKHVFLRSKYPEIVKCVMFYSDCKHEIKKITDGYRVALTYNVVLQMPESTNRALVDKGLDKAVQNYFDTKEEKLVFFLNHSYSEHSLKWGLLKGTDRTCALALLAVAKHQGRIPCLALAKQTESFEVERRYYNDSGSETELLDSSTSLYFWVSENSLPFKERVTSVTDDEMCYTVETKEIFEPYKTEESGPTGNAGETRDHWYRRACVVLWVNKWRCSTGFKDAVIDLHSLTTIEGNEAMVHNVIKNAGSSFYQSQLWHTADVCDFMIDIVMYLNDSEKATAILSKLSSTLINCDKIYKFLELERQFDQNAWVKIVNAWENVLNWVSTSKFIAIYIQQVDISKSKVVGPLLEACLGGFMKSQSTTDDSDVLMDIVCKVVKYINDDKKSISVLSKLSPKLLNCNKINNFLELERKFDNDTWVKIFNAWGKTSDWKSTIKFIEAYTKQADLSKSKVVGLLLKNCVEGFMNTTKNYKCDVPPTVYSSNINSSMNTRYIYDRSTNKETINHLCQLFHLCLKANNMLLENLLMQHVISTPTVFSSKGLAEIFLRLNDERPNDCARYTILSDTALLQVQRDLGEVKNHGNSWYWPIDIPCSCKFCLEVQSFFHSKTLNKVVIPAAAPNRKHVYSFLNPLRNHPLKFDTERHGSPYKIVIEKTEKLMNDRQSLIAELTNIEKMLLACRKFVHKNGSSKNHLATLSTSDKKPFEDHPLPTKRMKM